MAINIKGKNAGVLSNCCYVLTPKSLFNFVFFLFPESSPPQLIIKVPKFKRSLVSPSTVTQTVPTDDPDSNLSVYKLSLNKLYRVNPTGSPKFMCGMCSYTCDTHPKMKHHLYRHRPQKYKCPYCDHRKYPR